MKKSMIISMLAWGCCLMFPAGGALASGTGNTAPGDKSRMELHRRFPSATGVVWYSGKNSFTAFYTLRGEKAISHFTKSGTLAFTLIYRTPNELPVTIYESIHKKFPGHKITHVEQYLGVKGNCYSVLAENKTELIRIRAVSENNLQVIQKLNKE